MTNSHKTGCYLKDQKKKMCHVIIQRKCFRERACVKEYSHVLGTQRTSVAVRFSIRATDSCLIKGADKIPISFSFLEIIAIQLQET